MTGSGVTVAAVVLFVVLAVWTFRCSFCGNLRTRGHDCKGGIVTATPSLDEQSVHGYPEQLRRQGHRIHEEARSW